MAVIEEEIQVLRERRINLKETLDCVNRFTDEGPHECNH